MSRQYRGIKENKFANNASGERGAIEPRPSFQQHAQNFPLAQFFQNCVQINPAAAHLGRNQLDSGILQFRAFGDFEDAAVNTSRSSSAVPTIAGFGR